MGRREGETTLDIFHIKDLTFQYPDTDEKALDGLSVTISEGEFVVVGGPSGCGKSTLLRLLKKEIAPIGNISGNILYFGKAMNEWDERTLIEEIGFVFQDPENQIIMDEVLQEITFSLENLGYSNQEMRLRVAEMVHAFGMEDLLKSKPSELSGGEKQILNLLSVLLLKPKVLLLDEPTSQLDPIAARDLIMMLGRLNRELGITIILVDHRLEELFAVADRVILMKDGKVNYEGNSKEVIYSVFHAKDEKFLPYIPSISQLYLNREKEITVEKIPITVKECKKWASTLPPFAEGDACNCPITRKQQSVVEVKNVYFQYRKDSSLVLKNLSLQIKRGDFYTIVGGNGSGKSTLIKTCLGIKKPQRGIVRVFGKKIRKLTEEVLKKIAYLPQNPKSFFIQDSLEKEMKQVTNDEKKINEMLLKFGISHLKHRHPYDCSGGEMQKAALATMLLGNPEILFMDEPTKGLDPFSKQQFARILKQLHEDGLTIIMVTHDIEFAARHASRCAMMFDGSITVEATPNELFKGNYFYTTALNRATQNSNIAEVLTLEEALTLWPKTVLT